MFPTVIGVVLLTFILFNIVPNDLAVVALGKNVSPQLLESFDEQRGLNRPLFFGWQVKSRAYSDHDFKQGPGRWRSDGITYNRQEAHVSLVDGTAFNPLSFELDAAQDYEWSGTASGEGIIGGESLARKMCAGLRIVLKEIKQPFLRGLTAYPSNR